MPKREPLSYVCHWNDSQVLRQRLLESLPLVDGDEVSLLSGMPSIAQAYQRAQTIVKNRIRVFVHQDVSLPHDWCDRLWNSIDHLDAHDTSWGVLGAMGVRFSLFDREDDQAKIDIQQFGQVSSPVLHQDLNNGVAGGPVYVHVLDALLCVVNGHHLNFDPLIPGWHCAVEDLCMQSTRSGRTVYVSGLNLTHWTEKLTAEREGEMEPCASYLVSKWGAPVVLANSIWQ